MKAVHLLILASLAMAPQLAEAKPALCTIQQNGATIFSGGCNFQPSGSNGSFSLTKAGGGALLPGITTVSVSITAPNQAEVRGLTNAGNNSRWGPATRSSANPACWQGADFEVCAY